MSRQAEQPVTGWPAPTPTRSGSLHKGTLDDRDHALPCVTRFGVALRGLCHGRVPVSCREEVVDEGHDSVLPLVIASEQTVLTVFDRGTVVRRSAMPRKPCQQQRPRSTSVQTLSR